MLFPASWPWEPQELLLFSQLALARSREPLAHLRGSRVGGPSKPLVLCEGLCEVWKRGTGDV